MTKSITGNTPAPQNPNQSIIDTLNTVSETLELASYYVADMAEHCQNSDDEDNAERLVKLAKTISLYDTPIYQQLSIFTDGEPITRTDLKELAKVAEKISAILEDLGNTLIEIESEFDSDVAEPFDFDICAELATELKDIATDITGGN